MKSNKNPNPMNWMLMSKEQVLDNFHDIPNAYADGHGDRRFVFIPGTRKDRVLLVAHADTVFGEDKIKIGFSNDVFFSKNRFYSHPKKNKFGVTRQCHGVGIGADDRAGCSIVWELLGQKLGHSVLITSGEEIGCIGSHWLANDPYWSKVINDTHQFAVQFDRRGSKDIVFYSVGSPEFKEYVAKSTSYIPERGSFTDICVLCETICGVNMSVGYYNEHGPEEKLVYSQWLNTLSTAYNWLKQDNLPRFEQPKYVEPPKPSRHMADSYLQEMGFNMLSCLSCNKMFTEEDFFESGISCPYCHQQRVRMIS